MKKTRSPLAGKGAITMADVARIAGVSKITVSRALGDTGVVTCWLEQDYTLSGERHHVSAPTSIIFRRGGQGWEIVLFQSIPLPEDADT